jgi:hypothetical protein
LYVMHLSNTSAPLLSYLPFSFNSIIALKPTLQCNLRTIKK